MTTKFQLRPRRTTPRAMWKKYPTPFVWDNPEPEGDVVLVTAGMYKLGTADKLHQEWIKENQK